MLLIVEKVPERICCYKAIKNFYYFQNIIGFLLKYVNSCKDKLNLKHMRNVNQLSLYYKNFPTVQSFGKCHLDSWPNCPSDQLILHILNQNYGLKFNVLIVFHNVKHLNDFILLQYGFQFINVEYKALRIFYSIQFSSIPSYLYLESYNFIFNRFLQFFLISYVLSLLVLAYNIYFFNLKHYFS